MIDLARIKSNVAKMAAQNAPEADIDGYIASEGTTINDVRNFKLGAPSAPQGIIPGWKPGTPPSPEQVQQLATQYGKTVNGQQPPAAVPSASVSPMDATLATVNGLTGAVPFLQQGSDALLAGGQTALNAVTGKPADFGGAYNAIRDRRAQVAQKAPIANTIGGVGGTVALTGGIGALPGGLAAMGMEGNFGSQLGNSILSMGGYQGLQGLSQGHTGAQLLGDEAAGMGGGALGSTVGQGLGGIGNAIANKMTQGAQNKLITNAVVGSGDLADNARGLFQSSVDNNPIQITSDAYHQFLSSVHNGLQKFRPNSDLNQPITGMLTKLNGIADSLNGPTLQQASDEAIASGKPWGKTVLDWQPPPAVDLKDLHLLRQEANEIAQKGGSNGTMGSIIVNKIDGFINGLKTTDVAGGADPKQSANDLMQGISDWAKAQKVNILQSAVDRAQTLKSDPADNLKTTFGALMRSKDYGRFSPAEKTAIQQVAKGTSLQNVASLFGKLGFNPGEGPKHILGASAGVTGMAGALSPFLGPMALPAAVAGTTAIGMGGRQLATDAANGSVSQAMRAVMAGNIPLARLAPNVLAPAGTAANLGLRAALPVAVGSILPTLMGR